MRSSQWFRPPRHLLVLFVVVALVPAAALTWLSWRLLEQDRALENQRIQERLERAADLIGAALERRLSEIADQLPLLAQPADEALVIAFRPHEITVNPKGELPYYPFVPRTPEPPGAAFEAGEILEFQRRDYPKAITEYRELARAQDPLTRAGALVRLGRALRKNNQHEEALAVYDELAKLGATPVGGSPAELLARQTRCAVLHELNRTSELQVAARALDADLQQGYWQLDRVSYQFHSTEARRWLAAEPGTPADRQAALALAAAVESLWTQWQGIQRGEGSPHGRRIVWIHGRSILLLWRSSPGELVALVAGPRFLESQWRNLWQAYGMALALVDSDAHHVIGQPAIMGQPQAIRAAADTRLPWTLRITSADPAADLEQLAGRRHLLLAGLAMMGALVLVGGYFTARAVTRELAVAQLQSDFVAAVSHEFRTPLTSMRHLTESLDRGIVPDEDRRRQYYAALAHETTRLQRLVEGLLDFGRMEAGALEYRFQQLNLCELVGQVVADFQKEIPADGHHIKFHADLGAPGVRADPEAMARALWNLLDNAVKYSPGRPTVWVELTRDGEFNVIRVRDEGLGIPADEQKEIFKKFVRGAAARASSVKGTGLGLAMAQHIVRAHGGKIHLASQPGSGSTITILLPVDDPKS